MGFVEHVLGQLAGLGAIPLGAGDDGLGRDIGPRGRHQRIPAAARRELITAISRTTIQSGASLRHFPVAAGARIPCQVTTAAHEHPMSTAQRFELRLRSLAALLAYWVTPRRVDRIGERADTGECSGGDDAAVADVPHVVATHAEQCRNDRIG